MGAVLAAGPGAVASHAWALKLHGIERVQVPEEPDVTVPPTRVRVVAGVTVHRTRELERCDIVTVDGIPATSGARTVVDMAGQLGEADTMAVVDDLICRRKSTRPWLHRRASHLQKGRPGTDAIVRITAPGADKDFWSWLERRFDQAVVTAYGLPVPAYNVPVYDTSGRIGTPMPPGSRAGPWSPSSTGCASTRCRPSAAQTLESTTATPHRAASPCGSATRTCSRTPRWSLAPSAKPSARHSPGTLLCGQGGGCRHPGHAEGAQAGSGGWVSATRASRPLTNRPESSVDSSLASSTASLMATAVGTSASWRIS